MNDNAVHLFVFDTMADWEAAFAIAGINNPQFQLEPGRYCVTTVGASREMVTTIGGVRIQPEVGLEEVSPSASAMLILPGGQSWESGGNTEAVAKAKDFVAAGIPIAAICGYVGSGTRRIAGRPGAYEQRFGVLIYKWLSRGWLLSTRIRDHGQECDYRVRIAPVDFAYEIFKMLSLYSATGLEAWYALFKWRCIEVPRIGEGRWRLSSWLCHH
jgi:hypothetical protein